MLFSRLGLGLGLLFLSNAAIADFRPLLMASMGDSITAGTLSDLPIPVQTTNHANPVDEDTVSLWYREKYDAQIQPQFIIENKWGLSWASGRWISSHFRLLRESLRRSGEKRRLEVLNVSFPGDRTRHMPGQARRVVEALSSGNYSSLTYVTLLIGSNDVCSEPKPTSLQQMRSELLESFRILAGARSLTRQSDPVRVLLVGIPRIPDLGEPAIREHRTYFGISCRTVRDRILGFCNPLLQWETPEEYDRAMQIVEDRNRVLREVVKEANRLHPELEIVYSNRLYNLSIPVGVLAADCFHPGAVGQDAISREVWLDQPWFF